MAWLVAVDFTPSTERALSLAVRLAADTPGRVDLVHVLPSVLSSKGFGAAAAQQLVEESNRREREAARRKLDQLMVTLPAPLRGAGVIAEGSPAEAICETAAAYELVFVGTHGRAGIKHLLLGSVAERVVRLCPVPVLVVR